MQSAPFPWPPTQDDSPPYMGMVATQTGWLVDGAPQLFVQRNSTRGYCLVAKTDLPQGFTMAFTSLDTLRKMPHATIVNDAKLTGFSTALLDACYGEGYVIPRLLTCC